MNTEPDNVTRAAATDVPENAPQSTILPSLDSDTASNPAAMTIPATRPPVQWLGMVLPGPMSRGIHYIQDKIAIARRHSNQALPAVIVNHGSNVAAAIHTVGEVFMFKANGTQLISPENKGKPLHYLIDPPKNIYKSVITQAKLRVTAKELLRPSYYWESFKDHTNVKKATELDLVHGSLINHWQARATFFGMTAWLLNMVLPDNKDTPEETERMSIMATNHPVAYALERVKEAVWVPGWGQHKRQMTGLGIFIAGMCSFLGGWRNVSRPTGGAQSYYFNWQYCATGLMSLGASIPMLFAIDNEKGYSQSGAIHLLRCLFLPGSIHKKFKNSEKAGAYYYAAGHALLQTDNATQMLIGGAEKLPDGTIVDHKEMVAEAKKKALEEKSRRHARGHRDAVDGVEVAPDDIGNKGEAPVLPAAQVSQVREVMRAMPQLQPAVGAGAA